MSLITTSKFYLGPKLELELRCILVYDPLPAAQRTQIARKTVTTAAMMVTMTEMETETTSSVAVSHK